MNCPNCGDVGQPGPVSCQTCRSVFEVSDLERFNHLTFLRERLEQWSVSGLLPKGAATHAAALTLQEIHVCLGRMAGTVPVQPARAAARTIEPRPSVPVARPVATGGSVPAPTRATRLGLPYAAALPRPARPLFSWKQVGTYLLSERTLNGLLGIGAFLILAAAFVISTVNPTGLSPLPHLGMMVATTAVFYAAGTLVRGKLDLTRAGAALLGIGAAFIPLDALTLGRDTLQFDWATNWLGASMLCLPLYLFSHLMLRGRPFALLTTISGGSLLLAAGNQLGVPSPWAYASLSLLAIGYLLLGHRIHREWLALAWALFWTAQSATPFVMAALLAARLLPDSVLSGMPVAWHTALLAQRGANLDYAAGTAWWLGTVFYLLAARTSGQRLYRDIAAWVLPCALLFTLTKAPWDSGWDGFCLIPLAAGYLLYGRFATRLPHRQDGSYRYRDVAR
ncbi:MAG TPA: hypothetical protein VIJ28_14165, partial [Chloroflexota bacterium]